MCTDTESHNRCLQRQKHHLQLEILHLKKKFNSPPQLENQSQCRRKTTQLVSRNKTTQLGSRNETTPLGNMSETTQQEKTTQLVSRNETTQLCTAVDRLQPPAPPLQQNRLFLPTYLLLK
ncbi:hypothetical protein TNCV_3355781 [Trichonephila clavipes]|nr:hypothetical protein TNCV_3355781 [Trichonephila clavipes]